MGDAILGGMTIESDIAEWALERPGWQQEVLVALADGEDFGDVKVNQVVDQILQPDSSLPSREAKNLSIRSSVVEQVQLVQVTNVHGVNALVDGQSLAFQPTGMTVIYGNNGSGKSGYARLINSLVKARHTTTVLPDVFNPDADDPTAELTYSIAGMPQVQSFPAVPTPSTLKMSFYDEHCGNDYLSTKSTVTYRPSALALLDGLIQVCDQVRAVLQDRIIASKLSEFKPDVPTDTKAGTFAHNLTARTTYDEIDQATELAPDANDRLAAVLTTEARLTASNPEQEKARLSGLANQLLELASSITALLPQLSAERTAIRLDTKKAAAELRAAADLAATNTFEGEPLPGVGSETWRALWNAAREFSLTEAYHAHEFPVTENGAVCVLCQQPLTEAAQDRFTRFNQFITGHNRTGRSGRRSQISSDAARTARSGDRVARPLNCYRRSQGTGHITRHGRRRVARETQRATGRHRGAPSQWRTAPIRPSSIRRPR